MPVSVLKDVTVVSCAAYVTGPYATALLADLGARVIKIEAPPDGDPYRYFAPGEYYSPNFAHLHRNKQSISLDLKAPEGKKICLDLARKAEVFVEGFRPGTAERLGLGYETLRALKSVLVYCSSAAFGQSGLYAKRPGFDTLLARAPESRGSNGDCGRCEFPNSRRPERKLRATGKGTGSDFRDQAQSRRIDPGWRIEE